MASENLSGERPIYVRFFLLLLGEAVVGVFLYAVFTFLPFAVQMLIGLASWAIVFGENLNFPKNRSLGSLLCGITGMATFSCSIAWRFTHNETWSRLAFVGACLLAGLIFLDRRQEWFDLE